MTSRKFFTGIFALILLLAFTNNNYAQHFLCEDEVGEAPSAWLSDAVIYRTDTVWASEEYGESNILEGCKNQGAEWARFGYNYKINSAGVVIRPGVDTLIYRNVRQDPHTSDISGTCYTDHYVKVKLRLITNDSETEYVDTCTPLGTETIRWRTHDLTETGEWVDYVDAYANVGDVCMTRYWVSFTRNPYSHEAVVMDTACDEREWRGHTYTNTDHAIIDTEMNGSIATYTSYDPNVGTYKCPMLHHLDLTVYNTDSRDTNVAVCDTFVWNRNGMTFINSITTRNLSNTSEYNVYNGFRDGNFYCRDTVWLKLDVRRSSSSIDSVAGCGHYTWINDSTYNVDEGETNYTEHSGDTHTHRGMTIVGGVRTPRVGAFNGTNGNVAGCDSTVTLWLRVFAFDSIVDSITACQSYTWDMDGNTYTFASGDITDSSVTANSGSIQVPTGITNLRTYNDTYHTVGDYRQGTFTCDSVHILYLIIDNNYIADADFVGCDSVKVKSYNALFTPAPVGKYVRNDAWLDSTWYYEPDDSTYVDAHVPTARVGCDSSLHIRLLVHNRTADTTLTNTANACHSYVWHNAADSVIYTSGIHCYADVNSEGCDSVLTLNLTILPNDSSITYPDTPCFVYYDPYVGTFYNDTLFPIDTLHAATPLGCDSIFFMQIVVWQHNDTVIDVSACDTFMWYGDSWVKDSAYTTSTTVVKVNSYNPSTGKGGDIHRCDSAVTLNLTIRYQSYDTLPDTIGCMPFMWDSTGLLRYTTEFDTGRYTLIGVKNAVMCDSTILLPMHLYPSYNLRDTIDACDAYNDTLSENLARIWTNDKITNWMLRTSAPVIRATGTGCDSNIRMTIRIHRADTNGVISPSVCGQFTWLDSTFRRDTVVSRRRVTYLGDTLRTVWGCDSASSLNLTITPNGVKDTIVDECGQYEWSLNSKLYKLNEYAAVPRRYTDTVITYGMAHNGCDTLTILHLRLCPIAHSERDTTVCDMITWHGLTYSINASPTFTHHNASMYGCDSIETLNITVKKSTASTDNHLLTECDTLKWHGRTLVSDTLGLHDTITNVAGCDSVVTLNLTLKHSQEFLVDTTACDTFMWNARFFHVNTYDLPIKPKRAAGLMSNGCDSIEVLSLHLNESHLDGRTYVTACDSFLWSLTDVMYHSGNLTKRDERKCDTLHTVEGCDSVSYLILTLNNNTHDTTDVAPASSCGEFTWYDTTVYQGPRETSLIHNLTHNLKNVENCDSVLRIKVTVHANHYADTWVRGRRLMGDGITYSPAVCDSMMWRGRFYSATGIYHDTVHLINGCDSIYSLDLIVGKTTASTQQVYKCTAPYVWRDSTYTHSTDSAYVVLPVKNTQGCDTLARLNLTIENDNYYIDSITKCDNFTWNGRYFTESVTDSSVSRRFISQHGCDSVSHLFLLLYPSIKQTDTISACDSYFWDFTNRTYNASIDTTIWLQDKTIHNCDSARRLILSLSHSVEYDFVDVGCDEYEWNGMRTRVDVNGHVNSLWSETFPAGSVMGCDSTVYLIITIDTNSHGIDHREYCNQLTWNGNIYTSDVAYDPVWGPTDTVFGVAANGCDSIYVLEAHSRGSFMHIDTIEACDRFLWRNGTTYYSDNYTATYSVTAANLMTGCDSLYLLRLHVKHSTHNVEPMTPCDSVIWHGLSYKISGMYVYHYVDTNACPSADTLVLDLRRSTYSLQDMGITCNSLRWKDSTYTVSTDTAFFRTTNAVGCDSTVHMHVVINYSDYDAPTVVEGCDSAFFETRYYYRDTIIDRERGTINAIGCPDLHRIYIRVYPSYDSTAMLTACDTLTWRDGVRRNASTSGETVVLYSSHGCDSIITLNLTINYGNYDTLAPINTCDGYRWNDSLYTENTMARKIHGLNSFGCDSASLLPITLRHRSVRDTFATACDTFIWRHGYTFTHTDSMELRVADNNVACDSVVFIRVTINNTPRHEFADTSCESYAWNDSTYTLSNRYTQRFAHAAANGCDSVATVRLIVYENSVRTDVINECDSYTWPENGHAYENSTTVRIDKGVDRHGCDSANVLKLTIKYSTVRDVYKHECDSFAWHGSVYRTNGTYTHTDFHGAANNCDSTTNLRLVLGKTSYHRSVVRGCDSYTWYGTTYTMPGQYSYQQASPNASNCDSISLLHLTLSHNDTVLHDTVVCDSITWFGVTYQWSQRGIVNRIDNVATGCSTYDIMNITMGYHTTYDAAAQVGCDSLLWHGRYYTSNGRYSFDTLTRLGCDSTIRANITIRQSYKVTDSIGDHCGPFLWHDSTYTVSTNTARWHTSFLGPNGCDTVVTLKVNIREEGPYYDTVLACDSYNWHAVTVTRDTNMLWQDNSIYGCDSNTYTAIRITHSVNDSVDSSVCDSMVWYGHSYTTSGVYVHSTPTTIAACDTTITLTLTVRGTTKHTRQHYTDCPGYQWYGMVLTTNIDTTLHLGQTSANCDSLATIRFTVTEPARYTDTIVEACDQYVLGAQTIVADTVILHRTAIAGHCDSLSLMRINITPTPDVTETIRACDSLTWRNGLTYRGSTSTPVYRSQWGGLCDSVYRLHLTVSASSNRMIVKAAQDYYQWDDTMLTTTGVYQRTYQGANGCDSVITMRLIITDVALPVIVCNDNRLLMVNHYPYGMNYDRVDYAAYRWYRNGVRIPNATLDYFSEYGYGELHGCYHVEVAVDDELSVWLPSESFCVGVDGIDDVETTELGIHIMPNPMVAGGTFSLRLDDEMAAQNARMEVFDMQGRLRYTEELHGATSTYSLPLSAGIYTVRVSDVQGRRGTKRLVIR